MATVKVLGTGCHNCLELGRRLAEALTQLSRTDVQVERVDENGPSFTIFRLMPSPACSSMTNW